MRFSRRAVGFTLIGAGALVLAGPAAVRVFGQASTTSRQEPTPNRREFTIVARDYQFSPNRIEVMQDDLVKITLRSEDDPHSFSIDEYRIVKRIPARGSTTFEFRADRPGTFAFYCAMTSADGHRRMRGELVVTPR
jgi:cytochrome c oxidase subunit II